MFNIFMASLDRGIGECLLMACLGDEEYRDFKIRFQTKSLIQVV